MQQKDIRSADASRINDFIAAFATCKLDGKQQENIFLKMERAKQTWLDFIEVQYLVMVTSPFTVVVLPSASLTFT